jgi:hypothetical protein
MDICPTPIAPDACEPALNRGPTTTVLHSPHQQLRHTALLWISAHSDLRQLIDAFCPLHKTHACSSLVLAVESAKNGI